MQCRKRITFSFVSLVVLAAIAASAAKKPNIVYIMSDELAYYEVGFMGNEQIKTPRLDAMASDGIMFTRALAGAPVCAPLRCTLMTGRHMGHASVRANDGGTPLVEGEETIASILKPLGYATGGFGKWGCGGRGSTGVPEKHGFDVFFGYYDQVHAHSFFPPYLVRNSEEVILKGNVGGRSGPVYSHYEIMKEGLQFIRDNKDKPFFCYFPITPPHGMFDIPDSDPAWALYKDKDWPEDAKRYAAMVSMVDRNTGEVLDLLKELGLEDNTIVFFAGDNGGQDRFRTKDKPRGFFGPNVHPKTGTEFRGGKGNLYEGGLRIPSIARWPGKIKAGTVSDLLWYQPDLLPTLAELTGAKAPADIDGLSILPELLGEKATGRKQEQHEFLYWEYGTQTAVCMDHWKAVNPGRGKGWELYDLKTDISETTSVADKNPGILKKMIAFAEASHTPVKSGTFADRKDHERDRRAKWGTAKTQPAKITRVYGLPKKGLISNRSFKLVRASSESTTNQKYARNAFDGDPRTWWHSEFSREHPHELVIDLGAEHTIQGFVYLARQDVGWNGALAKTEFYVMQDPKAETKPVVTTTFEKNREPQHVRFAPVRGRYVKVRVLSEINGNKWASISELGVIGK